MILVLALLARPFEAGIVHISAFVEVAGLDLEINVYQVIQMGTRSCEATLLMSWIICSGTLVDHTYV